MPVLPNYLCVGSIPLTSMLTDEPATPNGQNGDNGREDDGYSETRESERISESRLRSTHPHK